jgi:hypothetical protein
LLNRYRVVKPYRGFESLRLRQAAAARDMARNLIERIALPELRVPVLAGLALMNDGDDEPGNAGSLLDRLIAELGGRGGTMGGCGIAATHSPCCSRGGRGCRPYDLNRRP